MKDLNELIKDVERDLVISLTMSIRHKILSKKEARDMAREFMIKSPFKNFEELFMSLSQMSDKYRIFRKIYIKYAPIYEKEKDEETIKLMRSYMKQNDFENAIRAVKGGE